MSHFCFIAGKNCISRLTETIDVKSDFQIDIVQYLAATSREAARSLMAVVVRNEETRSPLGAHGHGRKAKFS